jgi:SAM-dependent methyltransferase
VNAADPAGAWPRWRDANRANWEDRVPIHLGPGGYAVEALVADPARLSDSVRHDVAALGPLAGLRVAHLQCHIGTDTLSLARLGAAEVAGLDFSPAALAAARALFARTGTPGRFVEGDVHDAARLLGAGRWDVVHASMGAINWIPSIRRWLAVAASLLAPGGRLHLRDVHPMAMTLDPAVDPASAGGPAVCFPYGERAEPVTMDDDTTYAGDGARLAHTTTHEWSHGLGETVQGAIDAGLAVTGLEELFWTEFRAWPSMVERPGGRFELAERPDRVPLLFRLTARKPGAPGETA